MKRSSRRPKRASRNPKRAKKKLYRSVIVIWSVDNPDKLSLMDIASDADNGDRFYESMETEEVAVDAAHPGAVELLDNV